MNVHAVLLVPAKGDVAYCDKHKVPASTCCGKYTTSMRTVADPLGLLAEGPCGARPPMAHMRPRPPGAQGPIRWSEGEKGYATPHALVLAWDGDVLLEGVSWLCDHTEADREAILVCVEQALAGIPWGGVTGSALGTFIVLERDEVVA